MKFVSGRSASTILVYRLGSIFQAQVVSGVSAGGREDPSVEV